MLRVWWWGHGGRRLLRGCGSTGLSVAMGGGFSSPGFLDALLVCMLVVVDGGSAGRALGERSGQGANSNFGAGWRLLRVQWGLGFVLTTLTTFLKGVVFNVRWILLSFFLLFFLKKYFYICSEYDL